MIKKIHWLDAALRRAASVAREVIRVRYSRRPVLESSEERFDPCARALRCNSFGLLVGTIGTYR